MHGRDANNKCLNTDVTNRAGFNTWIAHSDGVSNGLVDGGFHGYKVHSSGSIGDGIQAAALSREVVACQHSCIEAARVHIKAINQCKYLCLRIATPAGDRKSVHHVHLLLLKSSFRL